MINGEEVREGVTSPDPYDPFRRKQDGGGDALSPGSSSLHYSSCGESEFERYCSANSMMGTPSMCSSTGMFNDCMEFDFGSLRSGFGSADVLEFENFSLGPNMKLSSVENGGPGDQRVGHCKGRSTTSSDDEASGLRKSQNVDGFAAIGDGNNVDSNLRGTVHLVGEGCEEHLFGSDLEFSGNEMEKEEDGHSSRYEHSEGEDSMYGTDDAHRSRSYYPRNVLFEQEPEPNNDNPLLIGSSVAFGSDDWDYFELETGAGANASLTLHGFHKKKELHMESEGTFLKSSSVAVTEVEKDGVDLPVSSEHSSEQAKDGDDRKGKINTAVTSLDFTNSGPLLQVGEVRESKAAITYQDPHAAESRTTGLPELHGAEKCSRDECAPAKTNYLHSSYIDDVMEMMPNELEGKYPLTATYSGMDEESLLVTNKEMVTAHHVQGLEDRELGTLEVQQKPHANGPVEKLRPSSTEYTEMLSSRFSRDNVPEALQASRNMVGTSSKHSASGANLFEVDAAPVKAENVELNDFYDDIVHDMEEILLDSVESRGVRFNNSNQMFQPKLSLPQRDGGQTATTSSLDDSAPQISLRFRIDDVEVVGAKQKRGDVSFSERLVGVKEYTVYVIRVWSDKDKWDVERRYRDFYALYRRLKSLFADQGWVLPPAWSSVEGESRKIFASASPSAIAERSVLIQECLRSILQSRFLSIAPSAILQFLSPQDTYPSSPLSNALLSQSSFSGRGSDMESTSAFGKTISLIVEIPHHKSVKQLLEAQHYTCAGCHKYFDDGVSIVRDFMKAFGWSKPRLCEYTGQLFCSSCHTNETTVLPARVLHQWDFSPYPVSQLAKSYLDSIHDQPMLCVSAVNPFLFSKVPALNHVRSIRKNIGTMLPYVRCSFRGTINTRLGNRRYVLESNDFFALRDLIDLSKGAFAVLPVIVETVSKKIQEHITEQCLICCDIGVACCARQACDDPSSLIFPFQEDEVEKCTSCEAVFHKNCFPKLANCHCGAQLGENKAFVSTNSFTGEATGASDALRRSASASVLPLRFLSGLFSSKVNNKDSDTVILMGSLPSNDL